MLTQNKSDDIYYSDDYYMPEFGLYGKNMPGLGFERKLEKEWKKSKTEIKQGSVDTKTLAKQFESLKKENEKLQNRLVKIEKELTKRPVFVGVNNLMYSHDVIDEIWDEEDDSL